jgi:hypothetical protein
MVATPIPHAKKPHSSSTVKKDANTREIGSLLTNDSQHQSKDKAAKLQAIKEMFEKYDKDNDGGISMKEFKEMSHSLGLYINSTLRFNIDNVAATQMRIFQINGKKLEFKNFMEWYNTDPACKEMEFSPEDMVLVDQIHEHFNAFDKDGSGIIDSIEFNRFYDDLLAKVIIIVMFRV